MKCCSVIEMLMLLMRDGCKSGRGPGSYTFYFNTTKAERSPMVVIATGNSLTFKHVLLVLTIESVIACSGLMPQGAKALTDQLLCHGLRHGQTVACCVTCGRSQGFRRMGAATGLLLLPALLGRGLVGVDKHLAELD